MENVTQIHSEISGKIKYLYMAIEHKGDTIDEKTIDELTKLDSEYRLNSSIPIINSMTASNYDELVDASTVFKEYITSANIMQRLNILSKIIFSNPDHKIISLMHNYTNNNLILNSSAVEERELCPDCNVEFSIRHAYSDQYCPKCGMIIQLDGISFEVNENSKSGPYKPSEHCETHINCIFAQELTEIPKTLIDSIQRLIKNENILPNRQLTCKKIRQYLKELKQTQYNKNVPKIRLIITGIKPPSPTIDKFNEICWYFDLADKIWMEIKPPDIKSRQYYPHRIRKIIEIVYKDDIKTRNSIIECIHLQEENTYKIHDHYWKEICDKSNGKIPFIKTEKYLLRY